MFEHDHIDNGRLYSRLHKTGVLPFCCFSCNPIFHTCRTAVSGNKRRYIQDGFDLDLTYVTERVIVHGFPAVGLEHFYRNPRNEIRRFLDHHHKDHYKIYNFCCEYGRGYHPNEFYGRSERYPFKDHNCPPLETMAEFANSAKYWLDQNPENIVSMHCKAGKGRAGLMCCCLLIRSGAVQSAKEALDLYDEKRVYDHEGLTVPSQRKFVVFYELLWRNIWKIHANIGDIPGEPHDSDKWKVPVQPERRIFGVELLNAKFDAVHRLRIKIFKVGSFSPVCIDDSRPLPNAQTFWRCDVVISGNFKLVFYNFKGPIGHKLFEFSHNTLFMDM
jgi:hypothetical protein